MIRKKIVYEYEGRDYPSLEKVLDRVEGDFCTFIQDVNNLLSPPSRLTHTQVTALSEAILKNHYVALKLLNDLEDIDNADFD